MPIPFLVPIAIAAVSATAATTGVVSGAQAIKKNKDAKDINEDAHLICERAEKAVDLARNKSQKSLENLGQRKLNVLNGSINRFLTTFEKIHSIQLKDSAGINELRYFHLDKQSIAEMQKMSLLATSVLGGLAGGAGAGALAAFGAYGATMTFATASTGTAIASLSGVAATNATLAFLGGGALAAGGGGMALGSAILGGAVAGPALAVLGIVMNASASKNLDNAYSNIAKAREFAEGCNTIATLCNAISARADLFSSLISKLDVIFNQMITELENVVQTCGTDYATYPESSQATVAMTLSVAGAMKKVLDTPIMDKDGNITVESKKVYDTIQNDIQNNHQSPSKSSDSINLDDIDVLPKNGNLVNLSYHSYSPTRCVVEANVTIVPLRIGDYCTINGEGLYLVEKIGYGSMSQAKVDVGKRTMLALKKIDQV